MEEDVAPGSLLLSLPSAPQAESGLLPAISQMGKLSPAGGLSPNKGISHPWLMARGLLPSTFPSAPCSPPFFHLLSPTVPFPLLPYLCLFCPPSPPSAWVCITQEGQPLHPRDCSPRSSSEWACCAFCLPPYPPPKQAAILDSARDSHRESGTFQPPD